VLAGEAMDRIKAKYSHAQLSQALSQFKESQ